MFRRKICRVFIEGPQGAPSRNATFSPGCAFNGAVKLCGLILRRSLGAATTASYGVGTAVRLPGTICT
jgi:hypothetical protein